VRIDAAYAVFFVMAVIGRPRRRQSEQQLELGQPTDGVCRYCSAPIVWRPLNSAWHPCDPARVSIVSDNRVASGHVSHFTTCPRADEARTKGSDR
jgi:hypothetical protein